MKSIIALAASTLIMTSAFMQPVAAQRRTSGNIYSVMGSNETQIYQKFNLFDTDEVGNQIYDTAPDNLGDRLPAYKDKIGLFRGAITNYVIGLGSLPVIERNLQPDDYDSDGYPILTTPFKETVTAFPAGDLLAELISGADGKKYIRYSIFEEYGVTLPYSNFILDPEKVATSFTPLPNPIELDKAVNNLTYILNNNLLDGVSNFVVDQDLLLNDIDGVNGGGGDFIIKQGVIKPQTVPEKDNALASIFALTIVSSIFLLKRHLRIKTIVKI